MIKIFSVLLSLLILCEPVSAIPEVVMVFLKSKYKDPVITEESCDPLYKIPGIKTYSVYEREYANEDPLIPDTWIYTGKNILPGRQIFDALKEVKFEPVDNEQAKNCALTILGLYNIYITQEKIEVLKKNNKYIVSISGKCSLSHPFFRKKDEKKCAYLITLGNKEYKLSSE